MEGKPEENKVMASRHKYQRGKYCNFQICNIVRHFQNVIILFRQILFLMCQNYYFSNLVKSFQSNFFELKLFSLQINVFYGLWVSTKTKTCLEFFSPKSGQRKVIVNGQKNVFASKNRIIQSNSRLHRTRWDHKNE